MIKRLLVANRGEIAVRILKTCQKLGIEPILAISEADQHQSYATLAKYVVVGGPKPSESYLNQDALLKAANDYECQAVHPGYGFLSENPIFAKRLKQQGRMLVGPKPEHVYLMGDKSTARKTMAAFGVPVLPGTDTLLELPIAEELAQKMGFPVLLKATAGGGGKGMRIVRELGEFREAWITAQNEALKAFSNPGIYLEKYIENGRHIELQMMGDSYGHVVCFGERECSIQRRHQKLLEEAPAKHLDPDKLKATLKKSVHALSQLGYTNAGTLEFLVDPKGNWYFIEMNTRIQVEHPITEITTGFDLVEYQIKMAMNHQLGIQQDEITQNGHAIECRLNAEDPLQNFMPSPGEITRFEFSPAPAPFTFRMDTHLKPHDRIPPYYDSLMAKLIGHAPTREQAIRGLLDTFNNTHIEGVSHTLSLHKSILSHINFQTGPYTCNFLNENPLWQK